MPTLRTYLCNIRFPVVDVVDKKSIKTVSYEDDHTVKAGLMPLSCEFNPLKRTVRIRVLASDATDNPYLFFQCLEEWIGSGVLNWSRKAKYTYGVADFAGLDSKITIEINHPGAPCFWSFTSLFARRDDSVNALLIKYPLDIDSGTIPLDGGKSVSYVGVAGTNEEVDNTQTAFVPGELLQLRWGLKINKKPYTAVVAGKYFASPAFTGGKIIEKGSNYITVDAQGNSLVCAPTDFANYQIGDWVFLLKQGYRAAQQTERDSSYTDRSAGDIDIDKILRVAPISVNDVGRGAVSFETIDFNMLSSSAFREFFEISQHIGVIKDLYPQTTAPTQNAARVFIEDFDSSFEWVNIFYHCQNTSNTENGILGFAIDDEVVILNIAGRKNPTADDLVIIGHKIGRKFCSASFIVLFSTESGDEAIAWDFTTDSLLIEKQTREDVVTALAELGYHSVVEAVASASETFNSYYFTGTYTGPKNLPQIGEFVKSETEPHGNPNSTQRSHYHPGTIGNYYEHTHSWINNEEDVTYKAPYLINLGGMGAVSNFQAQSTLSCDPEDYNSGSDTWEVRDEMDWTRLYFHGLFHPDDLDGYAASFANCETWYELLFDLWSDCDWKCTSDGGEMTIYDGEDWDGRILDLWDYEQYTAQPHYRGPIPSVAGAWISTGKAKNAATIMLYEEVHIASDVIVDWSGDDLISGIITDGCSSCDPTETDKLRSFLRVYAKKEDVIDEQMAEMVFLINEERAKEELDPLTIDFNLTAAAERHAEDMATNTNLSHEGSDGTFVLQRAFEENYYLYMLKTDGSVLTADEPYSTEITFRYGSGYSHAGGNGENCASADMSKHETIETHMVQLVQDDGTIETYEIETDQITTADIVSFWMASPSHRDNILSTEWNEISIAAAVGGDGKTYFCAVFGFRAHRWPGYSAIDTTSALSHIHSNFTYENAEDLSRVLRVELV